MQNENINGLKIFDKAFLYTVYADDTTFFLRDEKPAIKVMKTFDVFRHFMHLNQTKVNVKQLV